MANLIDLIGAQAAQQNTEGLAKGFAESAARGFQIGDQMLQTGAQLAQVKENIAVQKQQQESAKLKLDEAQMNGIANRLRSAAFAPPNQRELLLKNAETYAAQIQKPLDIQGFKDLLKDDASRIVVQKGLYDVTTGKVPPQEFFTLISNAPALFDAVNNEVAKNAEAQNKFLSMEELAKIRAQSQMDLSTQKAKITQAKVDSKGGKEKPALTPGQKALDVAFAKDYNDFISQGGYAGVEKNIDQLKPIIETLNSGSGSGLSGNLPKVLRDTFDRKNSAIQDQVEEIVQSNLKTTLGSQFTAKEAENFLARTFNPRQDPKENAKRLERLITQTKKIALAKEEASKYFEENGTLAGFKGKTNFKISDLEKIDAIPTAKPLPQIKLIKNAIGLLPKGANPLGLVNDLEKKLGRGLLEEEKALLEGK